MKDWQAALRTWLRNAAQFAKDRGVGSQARPEKFDPVAYVNRNNRAPAQINSGEVIDVTEFSLHG